MDEALLGWFHARRSEALLDFSRAVTMAGDTIVLACATFVLALVLLRHGAYRATWFYAMCCLTSAVLNFGLKYVVDRARPTAYFAPGMEVSSGSFPSGHALMPTVIYGCFAWLLYRYRPAVWVPIAIGIVLIGMTRLFLGVHYPTDVLTGWVIGVWVIVSVRAFYSPHEPEPERPRL